MQEERLGFRARAYSAHREYRQGKTVVVCPWCNQPIADGFHLHEWLVKRSAVPTRKQDLIMVVENCVPVHPNDTCHNQSREMTRRCLQHAAFTLSAQHIGEWYVSLWKDHGLSVPRGRLVPLKNIPPYRGRTLFDIGFALHDHAPEPPSWQWRTFDKRDMAFALWAGRWREIYGKKGIKWPSELSQCVLLYHLDEGYWLKYLRGVVG